MDGKSREHPGNRVTDQQRGPAQQPAGGPRAARLVDIASAVGVHPSTVSRVLNGDAADKLIVSARVSGNRRDRDGFALFVIDAGAPGVTRRDYATVDGMRAAGRGTGELPGAGVESARACDQSRR